MKKIKKITALALAITSISVIVLLASNNSPQDLQSDYSIESADYGFLDTPISGTVTTLGTINTFGGTSTGTNIYLQQGVPVVFAGFQSTSEFRVGITDGLGLANPTQEQLLAGTRWVIDYSSPNYSFPFPNNGTIYVPHTGNWRTMVQNTSSLNRPVTFSGTMETISVVPFETVLDPFDDYQYTFLDIQTVIESDVDFDNIEIERRQEIFTPVN